MDKASLNNGGSRYLSGLGAWALAFGCSVGWGAFVMPGTTFLPVAGPAGTAIGIALGALVMLIIAKNYHFLINRYPDAGGAYTFTQKCFGNDHGFLSAWFLVITYVAIIWANATALPLIARTLLGSTFQFGFHYEIAGFHVYLGEILLAIFALFTGALVCMRRRAAVGTQTVMAVVLFAGVVVCFTVAAFRGDSASLQPAFYSNESAVSGTLTIFALAPWAFVGFESISHSAAEAKFPLKRSFLIMAGAVVAAAVAYVLLSLISVTAAPEGAASWIDYINNLGSYSGLESQPAFFAAHSALGTAGSAILGVAALCAIFTGIIGNYIALSRLITSLSKDGILSEKVGGLDKNNVPSRAIWCIFAVSAALPFFGRTAVTWIVDVTTVGATIAFAFTSASALKTARQEKEKSAMVFGILGLIISLLFAIEFLLPNITSVKTLSNESYLILATWAILGFLFFYWLLKRDKKRLYGHKTVVWVVFLGLVIFTSTVWLLQSASAILDKAGTEINASLAGQSAATDSQETAAYLQGVLSSVNRSIIISAFVQVFLVVVSLTILFAIYGKIQKRENQIEVEKVRAEETSRAKTSFLSNMSHEIRTPMNAIIGLDNIALRDPDISPKTREELEKIGASAKHLLALINDILDMSRIESGRMELKKEEFSFKDIIDQINSIISGHCHDKGLTFEYKLEGETDDYFVGDDMKLKQILINILGNAVKFTDAPGTVSLTAAQIAADDDRRTLCFTVKDTGIGMDKDYIPKIFEAFSQEDATTTNRYGGSGLGMAITKNFVEMMDGSIGIESEKGVGSTFTVLVKLGRSERKALSGDEGTGQKDQSDHAILAGCRVLIAEDVDANAEILADLLDLENVESERAENGEKAVELFFSKPAGYYDAIFMDVRMPVMDGLAAASEIRSNEREDAETIPILAMSANVFDEDVAASLDAGMNDHLSKPIEPELMYESLAAHIRQSREKLTL